MRFTISNEQHPHSPRQRLHLVFTPTLSHWNSWKIYFTNDRTEGGPAVSDSLGLQSGQKTDLIPSHALFSQPSLPGPSRWESDTRELGHLCWRCGMADISTGSKCNFLWASAPICGVLQRKLLTTGPCSWYPRVFKREKPGLHVGHNPTP